MTQSNVRFISNQLIEQTIDSFWATIPPVWHHIRARIGQKAGEEFNLTHEQFHILRRIRQGHMNLSELAQTKHISRPAASRAVDALVERGLVSRIPNPGDRRHVILTLTSEGEATLERIFEGISNWMAEQLSGLEEAELQRIIDGLEALHRAFH
jgi:DNA-binding MarR family transcriptional regulator